MNGTISLTIVYGIIAFLSLLLLIRYVGFEVKKEITLLMIHISVFVVNAGYFVLAVSKTLEEALLANRISYLGAVFLPLIMLMSIMNVCRMKVSRFFSGILVSISAAIFFLAASGGYLKLYYQEVSLEFINGAAKLVKVYGPLHFLYLVYLLSYFGVMVGVIAFAVWKKKTGSHKLALFLAVIVLGNVGIWFVEQIIRVDFEFLSVSYVLMELLMTLMYGIVQEKEISENTEKENRERKTDHVLVIKTAEEDNATEVNNDATEPVYIEKENASVETETSYMKMQLVCPEVSLLTVREREVLDLILKNEKRKDIAECLNVSENTVKKHTSHIFSKLEVTSRKELFEKLNM